MLSVSTEYKSLKNLSNADLVTCNKSALGQAMMKLAETRITEDEKDDNDMLPVHGDPELEVILSSELWNPLEV